MTKTIPGGCVFPEVPGHATTIYAAIFDTDCVIADATPLHGAAWKAVLDPFLLSRALALEVEFEPFEVRTDYRRYLDGKALVDGVRGFLTSRGIRIPYDAVRGLACRYQEFFVSHVRRCGIAAFPCTVATVRGLRRRGVRTAAVSANRNCGEVLNCAGAANMFDVWVDGTDTARLGLPAKPDPGLFLEAARRLETFPENAAIIASTVDGVEAGKRGGFGMVVGFDPTGRAGGALDRKADVVVEDLAKLEFTGSAR